jgi:hypothetical protein
MPRSIEQPDMVWEQIPDRERERTRRSLPYRIRTEPEDILKFGAYLSQSLRQMIHLALMRANNEAAYRDDIPTLPSGEDKGLSKIGFIKWPPRLNPIPEILVIRTTDLSFIDYMTSIGNIVRTANNELSGTDLRIPRYPARTKRGW